jgi:hypothetical protein
LTKPDVVAPGQQIEACARQAGPHWCATSCATAIVSGVAARYLEQDPQLTPTQIRDIIVVNFRPLPGEPPGRQGAGQVMAP